VVNVEVKEDEMGRKCYLHGGRRGMHIGFWWERDHCKDLDIGGRIREKWDGFVWTGFI
jgi:hypothetical protein